MLFKNFNKRKTRFWKMRCYDIDIRMSIEMKMI